MRSRRWSEGDEVSRLIREGALALGTLLDHSERLAWESPRSTRSEKRNSQ